MGDKKTPHQIVVDTPGMTSVVTKEYLVVPFTDTLINKKFFLAWSLFLWITFQVVWASVLGVEAVATFYYALIIAYINFNLTHWVIIPIQLAFLAAVIGVLWLRYKKRMTVKELNRLQALRRQAYGGEVIDE